jgi:outer membrane protein assembly factor BamB
MCKKDVQQSTNPTPCLYCPNPTPIDTPKVDLVWATALKEPYSLSSSVQPIIIEKSLFVSGTYAGGGGEMVFCFDKLNGIKKWEWTDNPYFGNLNYIQTYANKTIAGSFIFDNVSGKTIGAIKTPSYAQPTSDFKLIENKIYTTLGDGNGWQGMATKAWLARASIDIPTQFDTICSIQKDSTGFDIALNSPVLWINPSGDSVLVFTNDGYNPKNHNEMGELIAYNLHTKQYQCRIQNLPRPRLYPIFYNNYCFYLSEKNIKAVNLLTGKQEWERSFTSSYNHFVLWTSAIIHQGNLYVKNEENLLVCLNANTGVINWQNNYAAEGPTKLQIYNGRLYYCAAGRLNCLVATTGALCYSYRSPNFFRKDTKGGPIQNGGLVIDPATNYLYFTDGYYACCIKLPK